MEINPLARINELRRILLEANHKYYDLDAPDMPDFEYDRFLRELEELESQYPQFDSPNSPTKRVGGTASAKFEKVHHLVPLMSLQDVFSFDELGEFIDKVKLQFPDATFTVEPKIDGLSVALEYSAGIFNRGLTRGDGVEGEDVTHNINTIYNVPKVLNGEPVDIIVRGEVYMPKETFWELNQQNEEEGKPLFANPRNAAAGSLRQLDPRIAAKRRLDIYIFNLQHVDNNGMTSHAETLEYMQNLGFPVVPYNLLSSKEDILSAVEEIDRNRSALPCDIDGAVIKVDSIVMREKLGVTAKYPKWAVAYKYPPEVKPTIVDDIVVQVGRTGVLTPKAVVQPVYLAGTTVTNATLHNQDFISTKDIRIGDTVFIRKAGEIIPEILEVDISKRPDGTVPYLLPEVCPACGAKTQKDEDGVFLRCTGADCPAQLSRVLTHFVSKDAMNIEGLGPSIIDALIEKSFIRSPADIYYLTIDQLKCLWKSGTNMAEKLLLSINNSKSRDLGRLIFAFGIRNVGLKTGQQLSRHFGSLERLIDASAEEIAQVEDIGEVTSRSIFEWFKQPSSINMINRLKNAGLNFQCTSQPVENKYAGQTFVFTGALQMFTREEATEKVERLGGKASGSVSKKTSYVVVGENAGSKAKRAQELGIPILTEEEFLNMLEADS